MDVWQVLCVFWAFTEIALARKYFSSIKAEILGYEIVVPQVEWISPQPPQTLSVNLNTTAFHYNLQLYLNEGLLSASFLSRFQSSMGHEAVKDHDHCFYHGKVTGEPEWTVVFSTCLGLRGSFGPRGDPKLRYHIEPLHYHMGSPKLTQPHVLYHGSQYNAKNGTCGTKGHLQRSGRHHHVKLVEKQRVRRQGRFPLVEWTLVNDHAQYLYFQRNLTLVVLRAIEIANGVDDIFKVQGVRIVVVDVVTWTVGDPITITKKAGDFLNNFRDYSPNLPQHYDSAMLFTGMRFEGSTIGIAFTATICETPKSAVGLVYDGGEELDRLISTTAHELGHIFGMDHDDTETCLCEGEPSGVCVMNATLGNPAPKTLSSCSVATLRTNIAGDLGRCLDNEPGKTITDPACGNGIQEEGEACDCGSATECIDPCCNATSCQLVAGAECRAGPCCEINCRFKTYGSVCRPLKNDCDIEEYCTGHHSECPGDFFLQDLTSCKSNNSYCYSGVCQTRDGQCQYHFGTNDAIDECYTLLNTRGSESGHCGFDGTQYKPCLERNAFCGQLQCEDGGILQTTAGDHKRTRLPSSSFICNSVTTTAGSDEISPGLVRDGTKCGDERVCLYAECVNVTSVDIPPCPVDSINGKVCSGRGRCNNDNQCSCSVGYTGSVCAAVVGAEHHSRVNGGIIAAAVIGTVVMVFIIVIIAVFIIYLVLHSKSLSFSTAEKRTPERSPEPANAQSQVQPSVKHIPTRPAPSAPANPNVSSSSKSFIPTRPPPPHTKPIPPPRPSVSTSKTSELSHDKPIEKRFTRT